jgi:hypothetical protein
MYTWKDIFKNAAEHPVGNGAMQSTIEIKGYLVSIVGGSIGLYGNFFDTFEVAIIKDGDFVTNDILKNGDDVAPYMTIDDVVELLNKLENEY